MQEQQSSWFAVHTKPRQEHIALENLERQSEDNRKYLSLVLKNALPQQEALTEAVQLLNASDKAKRRQGVTKGLSGLRAVHRELSERLRRGTRSQTQG